MVFVGHQTSDPLPQQEQEEYDPSQPLEGEFRQRGQYPLWFDHLTRGLFAAGVFLNLVLYFSQSRLHHSGPPQSLGNFRRPVFLPSDIQLPYWKPLPTSLPTRIAFGSCSDQRATLEYWDVLTVGYQPDLFLLMGDNVYGDCHDIACTRLASAYRNLSLHPSFLGAAAQIPVLAVLDDHDYGQGDCHADNPHKDVALQWYGEFFDIPDEHQRDGVYRSHIWSEVDGTGNNATLQLILLDTRYNRDPFVPTKRPSHPYEPTDSTIPQSMLGPNQWHWLEEQLQTPDVSFRVLVSSIQVLNENTGFEAWRHLPQERERLYRLLHTNSTVPTLILSGDRHVGSFSESRGFVEVTASSLTHSIPLGTFTDCSSPLTCDEDDPARVGDMIRENHFGALEIDWKRQQIEIQFRRSDTAYGARYTESGRAGEILATRTYRFDQL